MALNQIPYTNVHELNLDWVLRKLKEFEAELRAIEDYNPRITELESAVSSINTSLSTIRRSLNSLNSRCNALDSRVDDVQTSINTLYASVAEDIATIQREVDSIRTQYISLKAYVDVKDSNTLSAANQFTLERISALLNYFSDPEIVYVINPFTGEVQTIQQFIDTLAEYLRYGGLTAEEFESLHLTAKEYDELKIKALEYDLFGKYAIAFLHRVFITTQELDATLADYAKLSDLDSKADKNTLLNYATLAQIKVQNPVTGKLGTLQDAVDSLANFHRNGLTAREYDDLNLTARQFDNLMITAFNYDYNSKIILAQAGLITLLTGLTAAEYDSLWKDSTGRVYVTSTI